MEKLYTIHEYKYDYQLQKKLIKINKLLISIQKNPRKIKQMQKGILKAIIKNAEEIERISNAAKQIKDDCFLRIIEIENEEFEEQRRQRQVRQPINCYCCGISCYCCEISQDSFADSFINPVTNSTE